MEATDLSAWVEEIKTKRESLIETATEVSRDVIEQRFGSMLGYAFEGRTNGVRLVLTLDIDLSPGKQLVTGEAAIVPPELPAAKSSRKVNGSSF